MTLDKVTGYAQIILSVLFVGGYFICLRDFIHGNINIPVEWKDTVQNLISLLTAGVLLILHFWFQRLRSKDDDET